MPFGGGTDEAAGCWEFCFGGLLFCPDGFATVVAAGFPAAVMPSEGGTSSLMEGEALAPSAPEGAFF